MRVLLVNHGFTISGASRMLFLVAEFLISKGHQVDVITLLPTEGPLAAMYSEAGASVVQRVKPSIYELCIANTIFTGPVVAQVGPLIRTVWWIHESDNGLSLALSDPAVYRQAFQAAARIVFPARQLAESVYQPFIHQVPAERIVVLPNGIDLPANIEPVKKNAGFRVVSVAAVYQLKRQGDLLEALDAIDLPDVEAVFVGQLNWLSDPGLAILEKDRRRASRRYRFLGALPHAQAMAWLASADVFAHPAGAEAHPLAPLEAGLLRKPIVLADIAVYEDLWRHGHNCLIHPVGDCAALARLIAELHADAGLRSRLGALAFATAERYSAGAFLKQFSERVLGGSM